MLTVPDIFESYCYGPADILQVRPGADSLWLQVQDPSGHPQWAVYEDCIYRQLGMDQKGSHLAMVCQADPWDLVTQKIPGKTRAQVLRLLRNWQQAGYAFYLHSGSSGEYLVVARHLELRE